MNLPLRKTIGFFSIMIILIASCKKSDPAPLGAQVNAQLLAGDKGKSKTWKLREFVYKAGTGAANTQSLAGCFADNEYTFTNNDAQDYDAAEGTSKCNTTDPATVESGTWAFTLDGLILNIGVDNTSSPNGLFSSEIYVEVDANNNITAIYNGGYAPYPAFVKKIDANNLVLELTATRSGTTYVYTFTFTPA